MAMYERDKRNKAKTIDIGQIWLPFLKIQIAMVIKKKTS